MQASSFQLTPHFFADACTFTMCAVIFVQDFRGNSSDLEECLEQYRCGRICRVDTLKECVRLPKSTVLPRLHSRTSALCLWLCGA